MTVMPTDIKPANWARATWPLGAHWDGQATTFSVYAPAASRVTLELFGADTGVDAHATFELAQGTDGVWRGQLAGAGPGTRYGFRAWGPNWPVDAGWQRGNSAAGFISDVDAQGHRFNPNKLLFDPYGRELTHNLLDPRITADGQDADQFDTGGGDYHGRPRREIDTARYAPKSLVVADVTSTGTRPQLPPEDTIIYEAHVRGLTAHPSAGSLRELLGDVDEMPAMIDVPPQFRGTYAGAAHLAPYLKAIGVTTIELLPVHEMNCRPGAVDTDYWGYMTLSFFAPNRAYAADKSPGGPTREFKQMVAAFHACGIEVYLDVVYNHSGEGGNVDGDPDRVTFTSLGGFACPDYYQLDEAKMLIDGATGTGNQLNYSSPAAQMLVLDSLSYWADEMGVDGFRFDLAPVLGRLPDQGDNQAEQREFHHSDPLLMAIQEFSEQRQIDVIAEPWDLWGYEVGNFPPGWGEWNGRFRDSMRSFCKGDADLDTFVQMLNGDFRDYADQGGPQRSINFITAHDGFTMTDLVSYNAKINDGPWPFGPSDGGTDNNMSWDSNGDHALRRQRLRNFWTLLMISRGVPMFVAGDEYGRTQNGNNNPWSLDTIGIWNNWVQPVMANPLQQWVDPAQRHDPDTAARYHDNLGTSSGSGNAIFAYARAMMSLRRHHAGLRQRSYGNMDAGDGDVSYLFANPDGSIPVPEQGRAVRLLIDAPAELGGSLVVAINMAPDEVTFTLPEPPASGSWYRIADTNGFFEEVHNTWSGAAAMAITGSYGVAGWSIAVFAATSVV